MAAISPSLCTSNLISGSTSQQVLLHHRMYQSAAYRILDLQHQGFGSQVRKKHYGSSVSAGTEGSSKSNESAESIPSWARPDSDEPPPWARDEGKRNELNQGFEIPYYAYLLASAVTAIAAIGSVFEYMNQRPVFGVVNSDSIFYAPLLGFFAITGIPTAAFLWFKSVQAANKEAEEQDRRDGFL